MRIIHEYDYFALCTSTITPGTQKVLVLVLQVQSTITDRDGVRYSIFDLNLILCST